METILMSPIEEVSGVSGNTVKPQEKQEAQQKEEAEVKAAEQSSEAVEVEISKEAQKLASGE